MRYTYLIFFKFFFLLGCTENSQTEQALPAKEGILFYKDFDLFEFMGEIPISRPVPPSYPYLAIDTSLQDTLKMAIYQSSEINYHWDCYVWEKTRICSSSGGVEDDGLQHTTLWVLKEEEVLEVDYGAEKNTKIKYLCSVTNKSREKSETYTFSRFSNVSFNFSTQLSDYPLELAKYKDLVSFSRENNLLKVSSNRTSLATYKTIFEDITCYDLGDLSFFWWSIFGYAFDSLKCGESAQF